MTDPSLMKIKDFKCPQSRHTELYADCSADTVVAASAVCLRNRRYAWKKDRVFFGLYWGVTLLGSNAISAWLQINRRHPIAHEARVLSCRFMRSFVEAAWEKKSASKHLRATYPGPNGLAGILRNFELDRPLCFALENSHAFANPITRSEIGDI